MDSKFVNYTLNDQDLMGIRCLCKPGYEGHRCEKGFNFIKLKSVIQFLITETIVRYILGCPPINPCLNNGKCLEKPFGFTCLCNDQFEGNRCQFKKYCHLNYQNFRWLIVVITTNSSVKIKEFVLIHSEA